MNENVSSVLRSFSLPFECFRQAILLSFVRVFFVSFAASFFSVSSAHLNLLRTIYANLYNCFRDRNSLWKWENEREKKRTQEKCVRSQTHIQSLPLQLHLLRIFVVEQSIFSSATMVLWNSRARSLKDSNNNNNHNNNERGDARRVAARREPSQPPTHTKIFLIIGNEKCISI